MNQPQQLPPDCEFYETGLAQFCERPSLLQINGTLDHLNGSAVGANASPPDVASGFIGVLCGTHWQLSSGNKNFAIRAIMVGRMWRAKIDPAKATPAQLAVALEHNPLKPPVALVETDISA